MPATIQAGIISTCTIIFTKIIPIMELIILAKEALILVDFITKMSFMTFTNELKNFDNDKIIKFTSILIMFKIIVVQRGLEPLVQKTFTGHHAILPRVDGCQPPPLTFSSTRYYHLHWRSQPIVLTKLSPHFLEDRCTVYVQTDWLSAPLTICSNKPFPVYSSHGL